jgi:hypothetical protein
LLACASARAADDISVEARRREEALEVVCRAHARGAARAHLADADRLWPLAEFIPGMRKSRVVSRNGRVSVVEQSGEARFLFVSYPIEVTLSSTERPPLCDRRGPAERQPQALDGAYRIEPQAAGACC